LFTNGLGFGHFVPLHKRSETVAALKDFVGEWGIMDELVSDYCKEIVCKKEFQEYLQVLLTSSKTSEPYTQRMNRAEGEVREGKRWIRRFTLKAKSPRALWCYLGAYVYALRRMVSSNLMELGEQSAQAHATGQTPDIGRHSMFKWYEWVFYKDGDGERKLGRWIGISTKTGVLCHIILTADVANPVRRREAFHVSDKERYDPATRLEMKAIDKVIKERLGDHLNLPETGVAAETTDLLRADPGEIFDESEDGWQPEDDDFVVKQEVDDVTPVNLDEYLNARVLIPMGEEVQAGVVRGRARKRGGHLVGKRHTNPLLDTRVYEVEFPDGRIEEFTANAIAANLYEMADEDGHFVRLIDSIIDHDISEEALKEGTFVDSKGRVRNKMTTKGVRLLVSWKDGTSDWIPLKDLKESEPLRLAQYAVANGLVELPAFKWWVPTVLRQSKRMLSKLKSSKTRMRSHKYGIKIPRTVKEALEIDAATNTTFWRDALDREYANTKHVFQIIKEGEELKPGYTEMELLMVFDIKLDMTRKARLCCNPRGTECQLPRENVFSSVVSRDSVRLFFTIAAANDLQILGNDAKNAFTQAENLEKQWCKLDKLGKSYEGKRAYLVRALYGSYSASAAFRNHVSGHIRETMGFQMCWADNDVYMRVAAHPVTHEPYYEYIICYSDDILVASHEPEKVMDELAQKIEFKGKHAPPESYLGCDVTRGRYTTDESGRGVWMWGLSSKIYTNKVLKQVELMLSERGAKDRLNTKHCRTPLATNYKPELDQTDLCDADGLALYQGLIGILRWLVELGRMDIMYSVSVMSRYLAECREGHLDQVYHIFAYLKTHPNSTVLLDPSYPQYHPDSFQKVDWKNYYPDAKEPEPHNMPKALGEPVLVSMFVDASHANCLVTRRSHTGIIIMVNKAPIIWYSKRQDTVEAATMGSEAIAMRIAMDLNDGLRYKLRMMGVPIDGPTSVFCDNESVVKVTTRPESTMKKKHLSCAIHRVRECQAAGSTRIAKEHTSTNLADIGTKNLDGNTLRHLRERLLY